MSNRPTKTASAAKPKPEKKTLRQIREEAAGKIQAPYYVYVLAPDKTPLMPTTRFGKVRRMLKSHEAKIVRLKPFTIQLLKEPSGRITQPVTAGTDPGRTNIGICAVRKDGIPLFTANVITRNKDIPKLMEARRACRQASRRGERLARKRIANQKGTTMKEELHRKLPGYEDGTLPVKDIINTEARFNNRKRPENWLTPTATQLLRTHQNLLKLVEKILPVSGFALELNKFSFVDMEAGKNVYDPEKYQKGPLFGYQSVRETLEDIQNGKCLLCKKNRIEHDHHLVQRSKGGSNTIANYAGLCKICHEKVHKDQAAKEKLGKLKKGLNKRYSALSVLNQIMPHFTEWLCSYAEKSRKALYLMKNGYGTHQYREKYGIRKDHCIDAYCVACASMDITEPEAPTSCYEILQFRRHDRAKIHHQTERTYYLDGRMVAKNRNPRFEQKGPALSDWLTEMMGLYGKKKALQMQSRLTVVKSSRSYNRKNRLMPGTVFSYKGTRCVLTGNMARGQYLLSPNRLGENIPYREIKIIERSAGLVFL